MILFRASKISPSSGTPVAFLSPLLLNNSPKPYKDIINYLDCSSYQMSLLKRRVRLIPYECEDEVKDQSLAPSYNLSDSTATKDEYNDVKVEDQPLSQTFSLPDSFIV